MPLAIGFWLLAKSGAKPKAFTAMGAMDATKIRDLKNKKKRALGFERIELNQDLPQLVEGEDYYVEDGKYVFTAYYLLKRGYCCGSGCRHCPYKNQQEPPAAKT